MQSALAQSFTGEGTVAAAAKGEAPQTVAEVRATVMPTSDGEEQAKIVKALREELKIADSKLGRLQETLAARDVRNIDCLESQFS